MSERYRYLLRMPFELRDRLLESAKQNGRSFNAEVLQRLEESLETRPESGLRRAARGLGLGGHIPELRGREATLSRKRMRLGIAALAVAVTVLGIAVGGRAVVDHSSAVGYQPAGEEAELPPALARMLAIDRSLAPPGSSGYREGDRTAADEEFMKRAAPGTDIPAAVIASSKRDWSRFGGRGRESAADWRPLGPTNPKGLPQPLRDRSVYTAATPSFSGRIAHLAIDPNCGSRRHGRDECRLWIANANGGVWRTDDALDSTPDWDYLSRDFEHNNVASLEIDPNDRDADTIWAGTGEPNTCGSGCEAGVGLYKSTDGGDHWRGPFGRDAFYDRAAGSIAIRPGNSKVMFVASGRGIRGLSNVTGGADAIIPGAPHFGVWRSLDGGNTWEIVSQGAPTLCTSVSPDNVALNLTPCSPRGARRVKIDPVDPNTVYATFYARGIWRSRSNGDPGTWEQIMPRIGPNPAITTERADFDLVKLPNGETRMYVGVGGGGVCTPAGDCDIFARFRRSDNVRSAPAGLVTASWIDLTSSTQDTPGYSSNGYCDPQCAYDNYVFAPAGHFPGSGANADVVYLSGANRYAENNWGPASPFCCPDDPSTGRSNGRAVLVSTDAGASFTDMTEDDSDDVYPVGLHPDHHALTVNPQNWKQFFDVGDGGIARSNGRFVDDSGDCVQPKGYQGTRLAFCRQVLSRVPERITTLNKGLRTLHFYELNYSPFDPDLIVGGTQDNGSWERGDAPGSGTNSAAVPPNSLGPAPSGNECRTDDGNQGNQTWVQINIADGGHNNFDIGDQCFRQSAFQAGQLMVSYAPKNQLDMNWISTTLTGAAFYGLESVPFIASVTNDPVHPHWLWTGREHVFRSTNQGRNPALTKEAHRQHCNIWYGDFDVDGNGTVNNADICDDWKPMGDPTVGGRLTCTNAVTTPAPPNFSAACPYGADRAGGNVAAVERTRGDGSTLWAATSTGRIFVSKNADSPNPAAVAFDRIDDDPTASNDPPRFPTGIAIDANDPNHAWISYSGFAAKTPGFPGHIFEVRYVPGGSTFRMLDGDNQPSDRLGDIPATSIAVTDRGTIYVGTDYGCIVSRGDNRWRECGDGLPNVVVADLMYVRERKKLYAATHAQGVWELRVDSIEDRH